MVNGLEQTRILIGGETVSTSTLPGKQGKKDVADKALAELRQSNWVLIRKHPNDDTDTESISKDEVLGTDKLNQAIPDSNIGNKLLKLMGWSGGGVGAEGRKGISEPVSVEAAINRGGLGLTASQGITKDFHRKIEQVLVEYITSNDQNDLFFSPDFLKEERAIIHRLAKKMGLNSKSYDKSPEERYLTVSRKRNTCELVKHVALEGGENKKYRLIPPGEYDRVRAELDESIS